MSVSEIGFELLGFFSESQSGPSQITGPIYQSLKGIYERYMTAFIAPKALVSLNTSKERAAAQRTVLLKRENYIGIQIEMDNRVVLDGLIIKHPENPNPGRLTIITWGMLGYAEHPNSLERALAWQRHVEEDVLLVNYPGVAGSTGYTSSPQEIRDYAHAVIDWVLKTPHLQNRTLSFYSPSMGAVAGLDALTYALDVRKMRDDQICLIADRAFAKYVDCIRTFTSPNLGMRIATSIPGVRSFLIHGANVTRWNIDNLAKLKALLDKGYKPQIVITYHPHDSIIPYHEASLTAAYRAWLAEEFTSHPNVHVMELDNNYNKDPHMSWLTEYPKVARQCKTITQRVLAGQRSVA